MTEKWLLWCSLAMGCMSILANVAFAVAFSRLASRVGRVVNRKSPSESILSKLSVDQAALFSQLDSLATTVKRLSSRRGMQDLRDRQGAETKAEFRKRVLGGRSLPEVVSLARGS